MSKEIYVVEMGPGEESMMTGQAIEVLEKCDVIIGYTVYLDLLGARFADKEFLSTPMRQETKRCRMCFEKAMKGKYAAGMPEFMVWHVLCLKSGRNIRIVKLLSFRELPRQAAVQQCLERRSTMISV